MKKFFGLFIAIAIVIQSCGTLAAKSGETLPTYSTQAEILINLGIINDYTIEQYDPYSYIPNREFLSMLNIFAGGSAIHDYDSYARQLGAIEGSEKLQDFTYPTTDFAMAAALGALGYNKLSTVPKTGKRIWALQQGRKLGLTGGLPTKENMSLRRSEAVNLIYNMLDTQVLDLKSMTMDEDGYVTSTFKKSEDEALYFYQKIYHTEGLVDGTEFVEMYGESGIGGQTISIDGKTYAINANADFDKYVGVKCDIYIKEDTSTVLSVTASDSVKTLELTAEDIESYDESSRTLSYTQNNGTKSNKIQLEKTAAVISNGRGLESYKKSDIEIPNGKIYLYDNDRNGKYDLVRIESAKLFLVDSVNASSRIVYNKLSYDNDALSITADEREQDSKIKITKDGESIAMSSINENDVLEVYYNPKATKKTIRIIVTSKDFNGTATYVQGDMKKVTVDGIEYEISDSYSDGVAKSDKYTPSLKAGQSYVFYLDSNKNIIAAEADKYDGMKAGYLYRTMSNRDGFDNKYGIRIFNDKEKWENYDLAEKIKLNGESRKTDNCFNEIEANKNNIILIKTNSEGKVSEVRTATDKFVLGETSDNFNKSELDTSVDSSFTFRNVANYFEGSTSKNIAFYIGSGTKMFAAPAAGSGSEDDFGLTTVSSLKNDGNYTAVKGYGVDKFGIADYVVIELDDNMRKDKVRNGTTMLVSEAYETMNEDGETVQAIVGPYEILSRYTVTFASDAKEYDKAGNPVATKTTIEPGDLIRFSRNEKGAVNSYTVLCKASYADKGEGYYPYEEERRMHGVSAAIMYGTMYTADSQKGAFILDVKTSPTAAQDLKAAVTSSRTKVFICERNGRSTTTTMGSLKDLTKGDFVYAQAEWAVVHTIVVYK